MTNTATMARRSARTFENEDTVMNTVNSITKDTSSTRNKNVTEDGKSERKIENEFYRHSRNSSVSTCSERTIEYQLDLMNASINLAGMEDGSGSDANGRVENQVVKKKMESRPELNFGHVIPEVYRAACPEPEDHEFLKSLELKTILSLADKERPDDYACFITSNGIQHIVINMEGTKHGIPLETMQAILNVILDTRNYPMLIHCNHGRHRTGCVVGVVRKIHGMDLSGIIKEYERFSSPKSRDVDIEYITAFSVHGIKDVVGKSRQLYLLPQHAIRPNPLLTTKMGQLACGVAACFCIWGFTILKW